MIASFAKCCKRQWTSDEDNELLELIKVHGLCGNWPTIAESMKDRTGKQCRERYMNQLDPSIKKSAWTEEEDEKIKCLHSKYGKKWSKFIEELPGRSDNAIKNRFHIINRENFKRYDRDCDQTKTVTSTSDKEQKPPPSSFSYLPETAESRLATFRRAREILQRKIDLLIVEEEANSSKSNIDENSVSASSKCSSEAFSSVHREPNHLYLKVPNYDRESYGTCNTHSNACFEDMCLENNATPSTEQGRMIESNSSEHDSCDDLLQHQDFNFNFDHDYGIYLGASNDDNYDESLTTTTTQPNSILPW